MYMFVATLQAKSLRQDRCFSDDFTQSLMTHRRHSRSNVGEFFEQRSFKSSMTI